MIRIEAVVRVADLEAHVPAWRDLVERAPEATVFDTPEWVTSWLEAYWKSKPIYFLYFREEDRLIGVVPLVEDGEASPSLSCTRALVNPCIRTGVVGDGESLPEVIDGLLAYMCQERWDFALVFRRSSSDAAFTRLIPERAPRYGLSCHPFPGGVSPIIRNDGGWESYLESRDRHDQHEWRRKIKRFEKAGRVERRLFTTLDECQAGIRDLHQIEERSWKVEARGDPIVKDRPNGVHYEEFARLAASAGWLRLHVLYLDGQPVAYNFGVDYRNCYYALKTSYVTAHRELSPGIVLFLDVLRSAFERGIESVDLGAYEYRYKCELANAYEGITELCIGPPSPPCDICGVYQIKVKPFVQERLPLLAEAKRRIDAFFSARSQKTR